MVSIGPFQKIVSVDFPSSDERWDIVHSGTLIPDTDYVGQTDQVRAVASLINTNGRVFVASYFTHAEALDAWHAIVDPGTETLAHILYHWQQSTAHPTPPATYTAGGWDVELAADGWLSWFMRIGCNDIDPTVPDPHCPPIAYVTGGFGLSATADHALNWLAWQNTLGPQLGSATLFSQASVTDPDIAHSCAIGVGG